MILGRDEILGWLLERDPARVELLLRRADALRSRTVGEQVHLRGLVAIGNHCVRRCLYCALRAPNERLPRYALRDDEILAAAAQVAARGLRTVVLQAGERLPRQRRVLPRLIAEIRARHELAVTLSLGEALTSEYRAWRLAGAQRYLLKFETSDGELYRRLHPPGTARHRSRLPILHTLRRLGYEVGSGVMVGLPGQTWRSLARDIELMAALDLDMVAVGPYVPHPQTPLAAAALADQPTSADQVTSDPLTVQKVVALARLACPEANLPATTATAQQDPRGHRAALQSGANVVMVDCTPDDRRPLFAPYPRPRHDPPPAPMQAVLELLQALGRPPATDAGSRRRVAGGGGAVGDATGARRAAARSRSWCPVPAWTPRAPRPRGRPRSI